MIKKSQLEVREWLELPQITRVKLASDFNLTRSGGSEVINHVLVSDGFTYSDLSKLSLDAIKWRLGVTNQDDDFYKYFNQLLEIYDETKKGDEIKTADRSGDEENRKEQASEPVREASVLPETQEQPKKRRGRSSNVRSVVDGDNSGVQ